MRTNRFTVASPRTLVEFTRSALGFSFPVFCVTGVAVIGLQTCCHHPYRWKSANLSFIIWSIAKTQQVIYIIGTQSQYKTKRQMPTYTMRDKFHAFMSRNGEHSYETVLIKRLHMKSQNNVLTPLCCRSGSESS